jgi:putative acetyltransferase
VLDEYNLRPDPALTDADLENIEAAYLGRGGLFEVVVSPEGEIVGSVGLFPHNPRQIELRKMYLARSVRGRGLGKRLMERMIDKARALGFHEIVLETNSALREAGQLYRKFGFVPVVAQHLSERCDQAMALPLVVGSPFGPGPPPPWGTAPGRWPPPPYWMPPPPGPRGGLPDQGVGVPRRFGMGILLVIAAFYAVLFGVLRGMGADPIVFVVIALFVTGVGTAQALLFKGKNPRLASILSGALLGVLGVFGVGGWFAWQEGGGDGPMVFVAMLFMTPYMAVFGAICGYLAGVATAGAFCLIDEWSKRRRPPGEPAELVEAEEVVDPFRPADEEPTRPPPPT